MAMEDQLEDILKTLRSILEENKDISDELGWKLLETAYYNIKESIKEFSKPYPHFFVEDDVLADNGNLL